MKFIIFDIDGTLTDTKRVEDKCFMEAFEKTFRIDIWNQKWENLQNVTDWGITEEIIWQEWNRKPKKEEYELMYSTFMENLKAERIKNKSQFSEVSGARSFFYRLKEIDEFRLGIATGSWEKSAILKLETIGITLDEICFSNSNCHKTREAIIKDVIKQLSKKNQKIPERIIYFGDGDWDYKTCQNLGIDFIGIDIKNNGKLSRLGAKKIFRDYINSEKILNALQENID